MSPSPIQVDHVTGPRVESGWVEVLEYPSGKSLGISSHIDINSCQVTMNEDSRITRAFTFTWRPPRGLQQEFDWDRVVFKPWVRISGRQWPWGVFIASSVGRSGRERKVSCLDKTSLLDQVAATSTFTLEAGQNIVDAVVSIVKNQLPAEKIIAPASSKTTDAMMTWPAGTSYLEIVNDLLEKADYRHLRPNLSGTFFTEKNVNPSTRPVVYTFSSGELAIHSDEIDDSQDFLSVPNQVICTTQGTDTSPGLLAIATNNLADSPYSILNRGRVISKTYTGVEASDQPTLDRIASRNLWNSSTPVRTVDFSFRKIPLETGVIVMMEDETAGLDRTLFVMNEISTSLEPGTLIDGKMNAVTNQVGTQVVVIGTGDDGMPTGQDTTTYEEPEPEPDDYDDTDTSDDSGDLL